MKRLSKTRIISSTALITIYILFVVLALPCIGNKIAEDMKSDVKIELTSEEMICYDIKDVSIPVGIDEPFKKERRYYIRPILTENVVLDSYCTTTPFKINEIFTQYNISVSCPSYFSSSKSLYKNFLFYQKSQEEQYRTQAIEKANLITLMFMFFNFAFDMDICLFGDKITVYVDDEEEDSNEDRTE